MIEEPDESEGRTMADMVDEVEAKVGAIIFAADADGVADLVAARIRERKPPDTKAALTASFDELSIILTGASETLDHIESMFAKAMATAIEIRDIAAGAEPGCGLHPRDYEAAEMHFSAVAVMIARHGSLRRLVDFWLEVPVLREAWDDYAGQAHDSLR